MFEAAIKKCTAQAATAAGDCLNKERTCVRCQSDIDNIQTDLCSATDHATPLSAQICIQTDVDVSFHAQRPPNRS